MANEIAPDGQVFVCAACGKRSKDMYGFQKIDRGYDESCMLNSVLVYEQRDFATGDYRAVDPPPAPKIYALGESEPQSILASAAEVSDE